MPRKANRFTEEIGRAGLLCPRCGTNRGDSLGWFSTALDEFYNAKAHVKFFKELPTDVKQATVRAGQVTALLGHFHDDIEVKHLARAHACSGLLEIGLYQATELLNRGLLHLLLGHPSTAIPLIRMGLEVGVRSVLEQLLHFYIVNESLPPRHAKRFREYVVAVRRLTRKSSMTDDLVLCARKLLNFDWPEAQGNNSPKLDPMSLGWDKTLNYLEDCSVLAPDGLPRTDIESVYGNLSAIVHQRKAIIPLPKKGVRFDAEENGWAIRGITPTAPTAVTIGAVQEVGDLLVALMLRARSQVRLPFGDFMQHVDAWRAGLKEWPDLMLRTSDSLVALAVAEAQRTRDDASGSAP